MIGLHFELENKNPIFDDCPQVCAENIEPEKRGFSFCPACPVKLEKDGFRDDLTETLDEVSPGWKKYGFDYLYKCVIETARDADAEFRRTTAADAMRGIYNNELRKFRRFKEWQEKETK